jgi:pyruvate formate lyase activating enzyme
VRQNVGGELMLTTYGRSSGFCVDPIEKKPLNHFYPGSSVLSFGTAGCNLGCNFCQNWDISKAREMDAVQASASPESIADLAKSLGCKSVAFTYNDPIIFMEYAMDVAKECREKGVKTVAVSSGYMEAEAREEFYSVIDAVNIDLKSFTESFYKDLCFAELQPVLDTLLYIKHHTNVWLEITTLIIPDKNDSVAELQQLSSWIASHLGPDVPLHFSAFHPDYKMVDTPATPPDSLMKARNIALAEGLHYVYTGNVYDPEGGSTYCHHCKHNVIERNWYELGEFSVKDGCCAKCGHIISGHFYDKPGTWGRKRLPIAQVMT